jgi:hypothetical protein
MSHLNRWLIRLSYSFLIAAGLLGWKSYKRVQEAGWAGTEVLMVFGAVAALVLGLWGARARHRAMVSDDRELSR